MTDWPQIVIAFWLVFTTGISAASFVMGQAGMPKGGKRGAEGVGWFLGRVLGAAILAAILYAGGFWS